MRSTRGFTLVELLVVIAIIGILASLILTAVNRAKNSAGKATDLNNLKQIMVATHVYASDARDIMPAPNWDGGWAQTPGWLYDTDYSLNGHDRYAEKLGLLWPSLGVQKVYVCPNDRLDDTRPQTLSSYAMNGAVVGYDATNTVEKLSAFRPTDCAYWETDENHPNYFNDGANYPGEGVSPRHSQGGIQAVFDGSVNYVRLEDWYAEVNQTNRNRLWCYPETEDGRARP